MKKIIHKGRVITLIVDRRRLPNGMTVNAEIIEHPGAVVIVPVLAKDKVVLIHQYRPAIGKYLYELPAGTLKKGEEPRRCAQRELMEESGYRAASLTKLGMIYPVPGYATEVMTIFKAEDLSPAYQPGDADELITVKIFTKHQLNKLMRSGKIKDAKTICGLAFCGLINSK